MHIQARQRFCDAGLVASQSTEAEGPRREAGPEWGWQRIATLKWL